MLRDQQGNETELSEAQKRMAAAAATVAATPPPKRTRVAGVGTAIKSLRNEEAKAKGKVDKATAGYNAAVAELSRIQQALQVLGAMDDGDSDGQPHAEAAE